MDSNYHWQKQQVNERVEARLRAAEAERMLKDNSLKGEIFLLRIVKAIFGRAHSSQKHLPQVSEKDLEGTLARQPRLAK